MFCSLKWSFLLSSELSSKLQEIEKGFHDDKECKEYYKGYKDRFGQELPDCQFKGNKSKIQNLIRKVHIDADGILTEVQNFWDSKKAEVPISLKMSSKRKLQKLKHNQSKELSTTLSLFLSAAFFYCYFQRRDRHDT